MSKLRTRFTDLCQIDVPIMQGGMHYVGYAQLAAAVSNAGGLGTITALTFPNPEALRAEIGKCKELTKKPFAVNLTLLPSLAPPNYDGYAQVIIDEGVKIVETAGRNPEKFIKIFKKHGIVVIHKCTSIKHAQTAIKHGVDCISLDGFEAGGHPGEDDVTNWVLYPVYAAQISVPFIASGACANGKQLAAAIAMGAEGMNMGSRFLCTVEAPVKMGIKEAMIKADEKSTTLVMRTLKNTERVFRNDVAEKVVAIEKQKPGDIEAIRPFVRGENYRVSFQETGNAFSSVWSCGQSVGLINNIPTCKELITDIVKEFYDIVENRFEKVQQGQLMNKSRSKL